MKYFPSLVRPAILSANKKILLLIVLAFFANALGAQNLPAITTNSEEDKPIELKRLHINVFVIENIATTTFEMQFYNNNDRVMEGELEFPLNNGTTVSAFALDVNGEMRKGVVVEKEKATQAFEAVTRRNIDPGIVEVTRGNNFKARVYPIPPRGYKKAVISFEQELKGNKDDYLYQLPMNFKQKLEEFSVRVEVVMNKPEVTKSKHPAINLIFTEARNSYISEYREKNVSLDTRLAFSIPKPDNLREVLTYKGEVTSDNYFYINLNPDRESISKPKPSRIAIVWDESSSGKDRDTQKEIALLKNYLKWMQEGEIELKTFSNKLHTERTFRLADGTSPRLIKFLEALSYDGGTNLGAVDFSSINCEEILLFTDGISTFGEKFQDTFTCPVIPVNSSNIADHNLLEYVASASNGIYINAINLTGEEITALLQNHQKTLIRAEYDPEKISGFFYENAYALNGNFSCAGKVEGAKTEIKLHFGYGDRITETRTLTIDNTKRIQNGLGERIWAQKKLKSLLVNGVHSEVVNHGKKFSLVTPGTSLIVLDEVQDYVNYGITPPPSLQKEYNRLLALRNKENTGTRERRLNEICEQFKIDIDWWESDHKAANKNSEIPRDAPPALEEVIEVAENVMDMEDAVLEEVVVTGYNARSTTPGMAVNTEGRQALSSSVKIQKWESNAGYMSELKATDVENLYPKYLELKPENIENPSFYFDVATYLFEKQQRETGLRVLSNLAELQLENTELMRTLGRKLVEYEFYTEALSIFNEVMNLRSFEPHSYIDLGLTYAEMGKYQKAIDELYKVVDKEWDNDISSRFPGIEVIVLHDINKIIYNNRKDLDISRIRECFLKHMPVDIRVVIDWDANETDIDLWVTDPRGEKCSYQNKYTAIGGKMSNDITTGYGPEEFRLKEASAGTYRIQAKFYGSRKQTLQGNVTVRALVYTGFGSKDGHKEILTLQLEPDKQGDYTIGEVLFEK
ncbi:VIT domain-containing protein [Salinimicrobium flavum]|uniref:VIT domain-containing protein n=1 Tax=Salinimicrobium flavum TaxID=1737065 RepID=A0ABW5IX48_9FLAO